MGRVTMKIAIALDIGTTSVKVTAISPEGETLFHSIQEYTLEFSHSDWVEIDFNSYWDAFQRGFSEFQKMNVNHQWEVAAICTTSQGETLVPVDRSGYPLMKGMVWIDNRAQNEACFLLQEVSHRTFYQTTGIPEIGPNWPITKISWIKNHHPDIFRKAYKFLLVEDYLLYLLTGRFVTNKSIACTSGYFDIINESWWEKGFSFLGLDQNHFPEVISPGEVVGYLLPEVGQELGVHNRVIVVCGGMDQACGAIGAGNIQPGIITETTGTALAVAAFIDKTQLNFQGKIPYYCSSLKNAAYLALPYNPTSGIILKWLRDNFFDIPKTYDELVEMAQGVPVDASDLVLIPHFSGSLSPDYQPKAKGILFGLTLNTTRAFIARSILEGVAFMLRENIEFLEKYHISSDRIISMGGASKSHFWLQLKADVLQKRVVTLACQETTSLGTAILGFVALGEYPSIPDACNTLVKEAFCKIPQKEQFPALEKKYHTFLNVYQVCRNLF